jgi:hypothetical protein
MHALRNYPTPLATPTPDSLRPSLLKRFFFPNLPGVRICPPPGATSARNSALRLEWLVASTGTGAAWREGLVASWECEHIRDVLPLPRVAVDILRLYTVARHMSAQGRACERFLGFGRTLCPLWHRRCWFWAQDAKADAKELRRKARTSGGRAGDVPQPGFSRSVSIAHVRHPPSAGRASAANPFSSAETRATNRS